MLSRSEQRDGSAWFPVAEDAGFFAGAVAVTLEASSDPDPAAADIASGLWAPDLPDVDVAGSWSDWVQIAALSPETSQPDVGTPAAQAFEARFRLVDPADRMSRDHRHRLTASGVGSPIRIGNKARVLLA